MKEELMMLLPLIKKNVILDTISEIFIAFFLAAKRFQLLETLHILKLNKLLER